MKLKSHLVFSKSQRRGIFILVFIIIILQAIYWFWPFSTEETSSNFQDAEIAVFQKEIDSLKAIAVEKKKPKVYPFNPNFITDYKGYTLGMSNEEIDRLLAFRKQDKWINSVADFQKVTKVSDSLLGTFSDLFKFPEWITNPKPQRNLYKPKTLSYAEKQDLNTVSAEALQKVYGIGPYYSEKIVAYRKKLGGFSDAVQLQDIYNLELEVIQNIFKQFAIKTPKEILKVNLNTAKVTDLSELPNLNYEIARQIIKFREANGKFNNFEQLLLIDGFPKDKLDRIQLYLALQ